MENLGKDFDVFKDHLYRISEEISVEINTLYPDRAEIAAYLNEVTARENMRITLYDVDGNKLTGADHRKGYGLNIELKSFTVVGRKVIYVIELLYPFSIKNLGELNSIKRIRDAAFLLVTLFIVLLILYLHFSMVRPLTILNRGLETVEYRNTCLMMPLVTRKRNDELGELTRKFEEMQQRLTASYREQTEMIASISHDLKTPLTSIAGFIERLLRQDLTREKQFEYYRIIDQKAKDINELVAEFNDYVTSNCENNAAGGKGTVNLKEFFEAVCAEYTAELTSRKIRFDWTYYAKESRTGGEEYYLNIDIQRLRRVFANLVGNSLQHADTLHKISFQCSVAQNMATFSVEDDGPGVPPDELEIIFTKFYRIDKSRSREKGGSGLGLAICKNIIENHGGAIRAYLLETGGLGISFSLPAVRFS